MHIATISSKFQISIPKQIREDLNIVPGQQFIFIARGKCLELVPKRSMKEIKGILNDANTGNIRDREDR